MENSNPGTISPETRIGALLDQYPDLEPTLIAMSPSFKKLKNPVLRKTIGKVATLRQIAKIGNITLADLINNLRQAAGQKATYETDADDGSDEKTPSWFDQTKIINSFDARPVIEGGGHPMNEIMDALNKLRAGELLELITPFIPAPIIDLADSKGYNSWSVRETNDLVRTYFTKK